MVSHQEIDLGVKFGDNKSLKSRYASSVIFDFSFSGTGIVILPPMAPISKSEDGGGGGKHSPGLTESIDARTVSATTGP